MLRPSKHSHPDRTVIHVSALLLRRIKSNLVEGYDALKKFAKKTVVGGDVLFLPALNFLYLLGLIDYQAKTDAFEYRGPNEAI